MVGWIASAALVAGIVAPGEATDPPRVALRAEVGDASSGGPLFEWLVVRLLEEGYALADAEGADVDLEVGTSTPSTWIVRATGESSQAFEVTVDADDSVLRLEVLHRAVDALAAAGRRQSITALRPKMFALELGDSVLPADAPAVRGAIALAILDGGGAIAPSRASADHAVCVAADGSELAVTLVDASEACPAKQTQVGLAGAAMLTTAFVRGAVAQSAAPTVARGDDDEVAPGLARDRSTRRLERPLFVRGGAAVGFVARAPTVDPALTASLLVGREPGLAAWLDLQMWPGIRRDGLAVFEAVPAVGLRVRPGSIGRISFDLGALLGVQTHTYTVDRDAVRVEGLAADVSGEGAVGFAVRVWRDHEIQLLVRGGASGRGREHTDGAEVLWRRGAWRVVTTLGMSFGKRIRS